MKLILTLLALSLMIGSTSFAQKKSAPKDIKYTISPIVGYETVYRLAPTPHTSTRVIYGARLTAGVDLISGELEYTKGSDTELYLAAPEKIVTDDEKVKLGIRSTYRFNDYLFATGRLGGSATKSATSSTSGAVTTKTEDAIKYNPYLGASLGLNVGPISVSVGATAIIKDTSDMTKNDIQHTLSVSMGN
jgi:hypothetical protein